MHEAIEKRRPGRPPGSVQHHTRVPPLVKLGQAGLIGLDEFRAGNRFLCDRDEAEARGICGDIPPMDRVDESFPDPWEAAARQREAVHRWLRAAEFLDGTFGSDTAARLTGFCDGNVTRSAIAQVMPAKWGREASVRSATKLVVSWLRALAQFYTTEGHHDG